MAYKSSFRDIAPICAPFYAHYLDLAGPNWSLEDFSISLQEWCEIFSKHDDSWLSFSYEPKKWTVSELALHVLDTELIFLSRAVFIARQPGAALPGFDQDVFVERSGVMQWRMHDLTQAMDSQRALTIAYFRSFEESHLRALGTADGKPVNVAALGALIIGHMRHHAQILRSRYDI
jgi:hypothetical protein